MIRKLGAIILISAIFASLLAACAPQEPGAEDDSPPPAASAQTYESYIDSGKTIAVQSGEIFNLVARDLFKAKEVPEYNNMADLLEALRMGKADAIMTDGSYVKQLEDSGIFPEFDYLWIDEDFFSNKSASVFREAELMNKYNDWLAGIISDGTLDEIKSRWIGVSLPEPEDIPKFELINENGTLTVCDTGNFPPYAYFGADGEPTGFDYELICRFAQHMGMNIDINMMAYDAIIPYVISGKADMSACLFTITDERSESVLFANPTIVTRAVLIVPKDGAAPGIDMPPPDGASQETLDYTDFAGKDIAVITAALTYNTTEAIGANPVNYNDSASAAEDVRKGRVAGFMNALTAVQVMASALNGFEAIPVPKEIFSAQVAAISNDQSVIDRFNRFLSAAEADGTLDEMKTRWFGDALDLDSPMPEIDNPGGNGTLTIAICSDSVPYVYVGANGNYSGFSTELVLRFGAYEGMTIEFVDMEFGGLIPYVISEKADLGIANMAVTEERKKSVSFTNPFFEEQHGILALKTVGSAVSQSASYTDYIGKKIGIVTGMAADKPVMEVLGVTPAYYFDTANAVEDVRKGRLDGFVYDLAPLIIMAGHQGNTDLECIPLPREGGSLPMGVVSANQNIINRVNVFLADIKDSGILTDMQERWLEPMSYSDTDIPMPEIPLTAGGGVITIAVDDGAEPFTYRGKDGELRGFCVELGMRFAEHEGMAVEFVPMDFSALIPYVGNGKADLGMDAITITDERKKSILFSDPFYDGPQGILVLKASGDSVPARDGSVSAMNYKDFEGAKLGALTGAMFDQVAMDIGGIPVYYADDASMLEDVRKGRLAGFLVDMSAARVIAGMPGNEDLQAVPIPAEIFAGPLGAFSMNQKVIDNFNGLLKNLEADGTLEDMRDRWLENVPDLDSPMPDIPLSGENGTLIVATTGGTIPFSYVGANNQLKGYSVELAIRFAAQERMDIEFARADFGGLIPYVVSEKADLGIDAVTITEERKKSILFTDSIYDDLIGILTLKESAAGVSDSGSAGAAGNVDESISEGGFIGWLKTAVERNLITDNRWKMIVDGLGVTMTIAFFAQIFGTILGCFVCYLLLRKNKIARKIGDIYCALIYGTPVVVLLMITYYIIFGSTKISNILIAIVAFTIVTGAAVAQNLKGAIETVDPVEIEAARSIGFSAFKAFTTVTLPQAVRRAMPAYTNGFVELVKATAIVGYIAIQDLTRAGDIIRSRTYDAYFPLLFVAVIYLIVTAVCVQVFKLIIKKVNGGETV